MSTLHGPVRLFILPAPGCGHIPTWSPRRKGGGSSFARPGNDDIQFTAGGLPGQVILTGDPDGESGTFDNVTAIVVRAGALIDTIRTWFSRE